MHPSPAAPPSATPTTLVLIDPTAPDGESALTQLTPDDQHITLVVLLWDRGGAALRTWADEERIGVAEAAVMYLEQVARRLDRPTESIAFEVCGGSNAYLELSMLEKSLPVRRTVRPGERQPTPSPAPIRDRIAARFGRTAPNLLVSSAISKKVPAREVAKLDELGTVRQIPAATKLVAEGSTGDSAFVIVDGMLSIERAGRHLADLGPGEVAGELSLLTGAPCNADVVATADTEVLVLDPDAFAQVLEDCPKLASQLLRTSVQRLVAA